MNMQEMQIRIVLMTWFDVSYARQLLVSSYVSCITKKYSVRNDNVYLYLI